MCSDAIGLGVSVKIPRSAFDSDPAPRLDEQRRLGTSGRCWRLVVVDPTGRDKAFPDPVIQRGNPLTRVGHDRRLCAHSDRLDGRLRQRLLPLPLGRVSQDLPTRD